MSITLSAFGKIWLNVRYILLEILWREAYFLFQGMLSERIFVKIRIFIQNLTVILLNFVIDFGFTIYYLSLKLNVINRYLCIHYATNN